MSIQERREYYRLPIRVPIFIKGIDTRGDEFVELAYSADLLVTIPAPVSSAAGLPEDHYSRFPTKVVRLESGNVNTNRRVSVRFTKLLYEKP